MSYAELIQVSEKLPKEKKSELIDFARFLLQQTQHDQTDRKTLAESSLAQWINDPLSVKDFEPLSREEANAC